jgi:hypothetical protein
VNGALRQWGAAFLPLQPLTQFMARIFPGPQYDLALQRHQCRDPIAQ